MVKNECEEALDRLFEYIDGELTPAEWEQVGEHLKACPPCEAERQLNEKIKTRVSATGGDCAPEALRARIVASIQAARES